MFIPQQRRRWGKAALLFIPRNGMEEIAAYYTPVMKVAEMTGYISVARWEWRGRWSCIRPITKILSFLLSPLKYSSFQNKLSLMMHLCKSECERIGLLCSNRSPTDGFKFSINVLMIFRTPGSVVTKLGMVVDRSVS